MVEACEPPLFAALATFWAPLLRCKPRRLVARPRWCRGGRARGSRGVFEEGHSRGYARAFFGA
eukprot:6051397-Alexandrium_andersonii.AAC.1